MNEENTGYCLLHGSSYGFVPLTDGERKINPLTGTTIPEFIKGYPMSLKHRFTCRELEVFALE
jgi:hypothetical protein